MRLLLLLGVACISHAQLVSDTTAIPRTEKPPVTFVNGYQATCPATFSGTFGSADSILQRNGQVSLFFDNCTGGQVPIEELGNAFSRFLRGLRYQDGQPVPQVDVVVHSMGGLIVRSYLAGKQSDGSLIPPIETRIRKIVFIGTPHFGSRLAALAGNDPNPQLPQLATGSRFAFEMATWNQGQDDLRGADAIGIAGDAGNSLLGAREGFHDGVVSLTSASLDFALPDRTRVLPYCHTASAAFLCRPGNPTRYLAAMDSDSHETARVLTSFLNGTQEWRTIGRRAPSEVPLMAQTGGVLLEWRNAADALISVEQASVAGQDLSRTDGRVYADQLAAGTVAIALRAASQSATVSLPVPAGTIRPLTAKIGPSVSAVYPVFAAVTPRAVAPGMFASIYGSELASESVAAVAQPYPTTLGGTRVRLGQTDLPLHYVSPDQINVVLPETVSGVVPLQVVNSAGQRTIHVWVEPALPTLFPVALNAATGARVGAENPIHPGQYLGLYLTGLGRTIRRDGLDWAEVQPQVFVGGQICEIQYAGRAPGFVGLDQVNCMVPVSLAASETTAVVVNSGTRTSAPITVVVR